MDAGERQLVHVAVAWTTQRHVNAIGRQPVSDAGESCAQVKDVNRDEQRRGAANDRVGRTFWAKRDLEHFLGRESVTRVAVGQLSPYCKLAKVLTLMSPDESSILDSSGHGTRLIQSEDNYTPAVDSAMFFATDSSRALAVQCAPLEVNRLELSQETLIQSWHCVNPALESLP